MEQKMLPMMMMNMIMLMKIVMMFLWLQAKKAAESLEIAVEQGKTKAIAKVLLIIFIIMIVIITTIPFIII